MIGASLKRSICRLFDVVDDEQNVKRVITPLEFAKTGYAVVVRVRPLEEGKFLIDENGDAAMFASMSGGETDSDSVGRWVADLDCGLTFADDVVSIQVDTEDAIAPGIFRVAETAQQLFAIATSRANRQTSDFKSRVAAVFEKAALEHGIHYDVDVELPFAGGMEADFVLHAERPLIVIAANSLPRLLEAEIIHLQSQRHNRKEMVVAVAESQAAVGKKHFERANYFTDKTVSFDPENMLQLLTQHAATQQ